MLSAKSATTAGAWSSKYEMLASRPGRQDRYSGPSCSPRARLAKNRGDPLVARKLASTHCGKAAIDCLPLAVTQRINVPRLKLRHGFGHGRDEFLLRRFGQRGGAFHQSLKGPGLRHGSLIAQIPVCRTAARRVQIIQTYRERDLDASQ